MIIDIRACKESVLIGFNHLEDDTEKDDILNLLTGILDDEADEGIISFLELAEENLKNDKCTFLINPRSEKERGEII